MKTVRFANVVEKSGAPELYLSWVKPDRDPVMKKALAENRVMTVHQELRGGKKDYGTVGYLKDRNAQILLFPKSVRRFTDRRVVAIDYTLLAKGKDPAAPAVGAHPKPKAAKRPEAQVAASVPPVAEKDDGLLDRILGELDRAREELSAGKSAAAYRRLDRIVKRRLM